MTNRNQLIANFLKYHGWHKASRLPLANDASFRRYERLVDGTHRAILMDAPPKKEDVGPFIYIARLLSKLGYSAPTIKASDPTNGLLLLEDFGDETYTHILTNVPQKPPEQELYAMATDLLIDLHRRPNSETLPPHLPPYNEDRLLEEVLLFTDWYMPAVLNCKIDIRCRNSYINAWQKLLIPILEAEPTLVLRDYHVDNLVWLPARSGVAACGVLDFQDAVAGHRGYDLISLLEDARRDITDDLREDMMHRYLEAQTNFTDQIGTEEKFRRDCAILAAQRHSKVIGIFTRLSLRDAKDNYLLHIPRVWSLLETALQHQALAPIADWMAEYLPLAQRVVPTHDRKKR